MTWSNSEISDNTILVVDDEESILEILKIGLKDNGFEVLTAKTANEALKIAEKNEFRFGLYDIRLPDQNGIELSLELKKDNPQIVSILMTGYPGIRSTIEALRHHIYDYLIKPFRIEQVLAVIERYWREHQLLGENYYNAEVIRTLKRENKQLKSLVKDLMPDETRLRAKTFNKSQKQWSNREAVLRSYIQQQGNKTTYKKDIANDQDKSMD